MRYSFLASLIVVAGVPAAFAEEVAGPPPEAGNRSHQTARHTVYLNRVVLEALQKSNPAHYAKATQVMDAASELCAPGAARVWKAMGMQPGMCAGAVLKTSLPPKREISFVLDDTQYIALVTMRAAEPEFLRPGLNDGPAVDVPLK